ncbi:MAG: hypothetical protein ACYSWW_11525 [Planctomycetota bacterium]|jgi:hypothetical protein
MTPVALGRRLIAEDTLFGTVIISPSPRWPDVARDCGPDLVFIDYDYITLFRKHLRIELEAIKQAAGLNSTTAKGGVEIKT